MKILFRKYLKLNPFLIFSPFFILYIFIILKFSTNLLLGDEGRYYTFAQNLLSGFYSPPAPDINLWNGPGYPIYLTPFVWIGAPTIIIKLSNGVLQYLSIVLLFFSIEKFASRNYALIFSFAWALYYIAYQELPLMLTEPLSTFLTVLIIFLITLDNKVNKPKAMHLILTGLVLGFLALTKIIFGYVIIVMAIFFTSLLFIIKARNAACRGALVAIVALLINLPYLIYTHNLTGKFFYWGNSGGSSLYWMSTPIDGEFGDWNNDTFTANCGHDLKIPCNSSLFSKHHQQDFDYLAKFKPIEQDDEFKKLAMTNIVNNPLKYIQNCISNLSRMLFGIPNSYFYQREQTFWRILPNSIIISLFIACSIMTAINFKVIKFEIHLINIIVVLYLILSTLVSAYPRQFYVIVPCLFFWYSYIFNKYIIIILNPAISQRIPVDRSGSGNLTK